MMVFGYGTFATILKVSGRCCAWYSFSLLFPYDQMVGSRRRRTMCDICLGAHDPEKEVTDVTDKGLVCWEEFYEGGA